MPASLNTLLKRQILNAELGRNLQNLTVSTITTAGAATYTAAQLLGGQINRDPNGSGRSDVTPTAALLVAALRAVAQQYGVQLPQTVYFEFVIQNDADAAETITVTAGTGCTLATGHTMTIAQSNSKRFGVLITETKSGSEAYTVRNLGTFTT